MGTGCSEISIKIPKYSTRKLHLKKWSAKWWPNRVRDLKNHLATCCPGHDWGCFFNMNIKVKTGWLELFQSGHWRISGLMKNHRNGSINSVRIDPSGKVKYWAGNNNQQNITLLILFPCLSPRKIDKIWQLYFHMNFTGPYTPVPNILLVNWANIMLADALAPHVINASTHQWVSARKM